MIIINSRERDDFCKKLGKIGINIYELMEKSNLAVYECQEKHSIVQEVHSII